ncbi:hypothetical protein ACFU8Q_40640, partial [Streptomyces sp. NPDC057543]|uniref:hypothetical protein n=1 Tax=Streptomyces sp. NPDC057543 TaxID=3346163 RepID=UPI00367846D6
MTATTSVTWHHGTVLDDGTPYPLRHRLSARAYEAPALSARVLGLSDVQSRAGCAAHELGHAVLWLSSGIHVRRVGVVVGRGGQAECGPVGRDRMLGWAVALAAGERAQ